MNQMTSDAPQRLQKYLASCGAGSRRYCEQLIAEGRVGVNGVTVARMGVTVTDMDRVTLDGRELRPKHYRYYVLNKPRGYISSNYDPHHHRYARDLITVSDKHVLFHVGRLDISSTGLMIYTNDGDFAQRIQHPSFQVEKEYYITVSDKISEKDLKSCLRGVQLNDGIVYKIKRYSLISDYAFTLVLTEGKNREIRRLLEHLRYTVDMLHRIRIGPIELGDLPPGTFREINWDVVSMCLSMSKKDSTEHGCSN